MKKYLQLYAASVLSIVAFQSIATETSVSAPLMELEQQQVLFVKRPHTPVKVHTNQGNLVTYALKNLSYRNRYTLVPFIKIDAYDQDVVAIDVVPTDKNNACEYDPLTQTFSIGPRERCTMGLLFRGEQDGAGKIDFKIKYGQHGILEEEDIEFKVALPEWQSTHGPEGGSITDIVFSTHHDVKSGAVFASTRNAGIYKSFDSGEEWFAVNKGLGSAPDILTLIGNANGTLFAGSDGFGVYQSTDQGKSWHAINGSLGNKLPANAIIDTLLYDELTQTLYADTSGSGLFKSSDGGKNWFPASGDAPNTLPAGKTVSSLYVTHGGTLYAGIKSPGAFAPLYSSTDGGDNWFAANGTGLPQADILSIVALDNTLYVAANNFGIYQSTDNGSTWVQVNGNLSGSQLLNGTLMVDNDTIYLGTRAGVFSSTDPLNNGWNDITYDLVNTYIFSLAINPRDGNLFLSNNGGGIFKLLANDTWKSINDDLVATSIQQSLTVADNGHWLAGSAGGGVFEFNPHAPYKGWVAVNDGLLNLDIRGIATNKQFWYTSTNGGSAKGLGGIFQRNSVAGPWKQVYNTVPQNRDNNGRATLITPDNSVYYGSLLNAAGGGLFKSVDNGATWSRQLVQNILGLAFDYASCYPVSTHCKIYAATDVTGVYLSTDNGNTFTPAPYDANPAQNCLPQSINARAVAVAPNGDAFTGIEFSGSVYGVYKLTPGGVCFKPANQGLPTNSFVYNLAIAANTAGLYDIYAATDNGVYKSTDGGESWVAHNANLPYLAIRSLAIAYMPRDYIVLAGTNGQAVFSSGSYKHK